MPLYRVLSKADDDLFSDGGSNFYELVYARNADQAKRKAARRRNISVDMIPAYKLYTDRRGLPSDPKLTKLRTGIKE